MSGHSKWSTIKNKKGVADAKKGKVFGELSKLIRISVREGASGDPKFNPSLRVLLDKARAANMPNEKVQKAIDSGLGKNSSGQAIQEIVYEGFGPHGVAMVIVAMTDNTQRTTGEVRSTLSKAGGSLGGPNTVMYMFNRTPQGEYVCTMPMEADEELSEKIEALTEKLRECEDVEEVFTSLVQQGAE
jgi:YebC/PmpR family DNA-binding regulatory protein